MLLKAGDLQKLSSEVTGKAAKSLKAMIIFPPSRRAVRAMYTFHNETENSGLGCKPPLGPMFVAAYLKQNTDHQVKIIDCQVSNLSDEQIKAEIRAYQPDVVGICAWTDFWYDAWKCVQLAKEVNPNIHVNVGGPHVGIYPGETLTHSGCDSVIVGDGEVPFAWMLNALSHGETPADLPGLHFKVNGVKTCDKLFYIHGDLDSLPFPDRNMLPFKLYRSVLAKDDFVTTAITSRGCPYRCTFCKLSFQKTLSRTAENVVDEFQQIAEMGIREIEVYDDTFTWSKNRLIDICKGLVDRGLSDVIDWAIRDRVSSPTPETMHWLKRGGCRRIHFGVESGSDKTLKTIKKSIVTDQAIEACKLAKREGMEVLTYFMIGLPGETVEDMRSTIAFAKKLDADYATFSVTVPYAGTEMYEDGLKNGVIPVDYWREYAKAPAPNFVVPHFWEEFLNKEQLLRMRDEATRNFYFRPKYIFREILKVDSMKEFMRKARMGLNLFQTSILHNGEGVYLENVAAEMGGGVGSRFANNMANPVSNRS